MGEEFNEGIDSQAKTETRLILGGFITAVGVAVLVMVMALVRAKWFADKPASFSPFLVLFPIALAAAALFTAVNPFGPWATKPKPSGRSEEAPLWFRPNMIFGLLGSSRPFCVAVGSLSLLVAVEMTLELGAQAKRLHVYDQFALTLPVGDAAPPEVLATSSVGTISLQKGSSVISDARSAVATSRAHPGSQALLVWWVERERKSLPEGALPMLLGGLFICAFGIWFPRLSLSETQGAAGISEKLVAPILSLALVGLGATQQADAAKDDKNMELASRGLPAVVSLSREERITHTEQTQERLVALQAGGLSPEAAKYLSDKLDHISERVGATDAKDTKLVGAIGGINERLFQIQNVINHPTSTPQAMYAADVTAIRNALTDLDKTAGLSLAASAADHSGSCDLFALEEKEAQKAAPEVTALTTAAAKKDESRDTFLKLHFWQRIGQPVPQDGSADRQRLRDLTEAQRNASLRLQALCSAHTQTASR